VRWKAVSQRRQRGFGRAGGRRAWVAVKYLHGKLRNGWAGVFEGGVLKLHSARGTGEKGESGGDEGCEAKWSLIPDPFSFSRSCRLGEFRLLRHNPFSNLYSLHSFPRTSPPARRINFMTTHLPAPPRKLLPYRQIVLLPYPVLFIFSIVVDRIRINSIPVSRWVIEIDAWLPLSGFLIAFALVLLARSLLPPRERIAFFIYSFLFAIFIISPVIQSPRPQPKYYRLESNALALTLAARNYAHAHDGSFPSHWAALLLSDGTNPYKLIDSTMTPPNIPNPRPAEGQWPAFAAEVDAHSIFVYTATDLRDAALIADAFRPSLDSALIIAYTRESPDTPNHRLLLFAHGDPQLIPESDLPKFLTACNIARATLGLPPLVIQK
jgi:hypothetical protein